mgnify:CR=1 FL=1
MPFTHTNKVAYTYSAGGVNENKTISVAETEDAEINIDYLLYIVTPTDGTKEYDVPGFEFTTAAAAVSTHFRLDGVNGALWANGATSGTKITDLEDGVPYVWTKNGGISHPAGTSNKLVNSIAKLTVIPDVYNDPNNLGNSVDTAITLKVRVLYDPLVV